MRDPGRDRSSGPPRAPARSAAALRSAPRDVVAGRLVGDRGHAARRRRAAATTCTAPTPSVADGRRRSGRSPAAARLRARRPIEIERPLAVVRDVLPHLDLLHPRRASGRPAVRLRVRAAWRGGAARRSFRMPRIVRGRCCSRVAQGHERVKGRRERMRRKRRCLGRCSGARVSGVGRDACTFSGATPAVREELLQPIRHVLHPPLLRHLPPARAQPLAQLAVATAAR